VNPAPVPRCSACSSCSHADGHADWCGRLGFAHDPNPAMSDRDVVELLGDGAHRDDRGVWQKPSRPLDLTHSRRARGRARGARRCLSCGADPYERDHPGWCPDATSSVGAELRNARDLEHAMRWKPPELNLPKHTAPESQQLAILFDALVRASEQRGRPPRKLWSIREYRDLVARRDGRA
jgi:hypothetical protein